MMFGPRHTIESLKVAIAKLDAQGKSTATLRVRLKDMRNSEIVAGLKAAKRRAEKKEVALADQADATLEKSA